MKQLMEKGKSAFMSVSLQERKVSVLFLAEGSSYYDVLALVLGTRDKFNGAVLLFCSFLLLELSSFLVSFVSY